DLAADRGETVDLAARYPERAARLAADWQAWFDAVSEPAPAWQLPGAWPDRIVATAAADPAHGFAVSWRTHAGIGEAVAEIARAGPQARFDESATRVSGTSETLDLESALVRAGAGHAGARVPAA